MLHKKNFKWGPSGSNNQKFVKKKLKLFYECEDVALDVDLQKTIFKKNEVQLI